MTRRKPPKEKRLHCDIEAEKAVLNCVLLDPKQMAIVEQDGLEPSHFYDDANREIFTAMLALFRRGIDVDAAVLVAELRAHIVGGRSSLDLIGGASYLATIINMKAMVSHNAIHLAGTVIEHSQRRDQELGAAKLLERIDAGLAIDEVDAFIDGWAEQNRERRTRKDGPKTVKQLIQNHRELRPAIIENLLREGETMNVIAAPKTGKSWLVTGLALSVASGGWWLQSYKTVKGKVLVIDNELHPETSADRIPRVAEAMGISPEDYENDLLVENMRGKLVDIFGLEKYFEQFKPGELKIVVLDALYRFLPPDTDENGNGALAQVYNAIDRYANRLKAAFILVHHTSKGNQSGKNITDVGAGAGTQSRAPDTHLILRQHEEKDAVVLDAVTRSWKPIDPCCLRWSFPRWIPDSTLDPSKLRREQPRRRQDTNKDESPAPAWTAARFASQFISDSPIAKAAIIDTAVEAGMSDKKAANLLGKAAAKNLVYEWKMPGDKRKAFYASVEQPREDGGKDA